MRRRTAPAHDRRRRVLRSSRTTQTTSAAQTEALGAEIARELRPGDVVVVAGEMGTGKTTFVRGALRALGVRLPVTSPTFTIGRRYDDGRLPVSHLDLHRVASLEEEDPALLADYVSADRVAFVEWPEVAAGTLEPVAEVTLEHAGGDRRTAAIRWRA